MGKRAWGLLFVSILLILTASFILADSHDLTEQEKIDDAYQCLEDKTEDKCDSLSTEEKIFSLLAIGECQSELLSASRNDGECWPKGVTGACDIKTTAQAVIALDNVNADVDSAKDWLKSQKTIPGDIEWFLEIDTQNASSCAITYSSSGQTFNENILEDKTLTNNAGSCLNLAQSNYWLRISSSCFSEEFEVSCQDSFLTTLLFQESGSSTVHVSEKTSSASPQGSTFETVDSSCFGNSASGCDYEGSLWAAMALSSLGENVTSYMPYLITKANENERFIPETFLYFLTGNTDYRSQVLLGQKSNKWWSESGDRYYDTALAMFPFQNEDPTEKENSKSWLLTSQDGEGCWQGNVRNTAFILASLWPKSVSSGGGGGNGGGTIDNLGCESAGNYCMSGINCEGEILDGFSCPGFASSCCSQPQRLDTCSDIGGNVCSSGEICQSGTVFSSSGLGSGESCCVGGFCETISGSGDLTECELEGGTCDFTCNSNEEESTASCGSSGEICCKFQPQKQSSGGLLWVWVLLILITLAVVGIVFRDKLRMFFFKLKSKFGKGKGSSSRPSRGPRFGPGSMPPRRPSRRPLRRIPERKILLPGSSTPVPSQVKHQPKRFRKPTKSQKELDSVLSKLKDMSK